MVILPLAVSSVSICTHYAHTCVYIIYTYVFAYCFGIKIKLINLRTCNLVYTYVHTSCMYMVCCGPSPAWPGSARSVG